jgi:PAS domain-containing protein
MSASSAPLPARSTDLLASAFDALPLPSFVVDQDFNIIDFNLAAAGLLDRVPCALLRLRGGGPVECLHSIETEEGAAIAACQDCVVKNFVKEIFGQPSARRKTGQLRLKGEGGISDVDFLITVAPIMDDSEPLVLVILDDAAELSALVAPKARPATPASSSPGSKARAKARGRKTGSS